MKQAQSIRQIQSTAKYHHTTSFTNNSIVWYGMLSILHPVNRHDSFQLSNTKWDPGADFQEEFWCRDYNQVGYTQPVVSTNVHTNKPYSNTWGKKAREICESAYAWIDYWR